MKYEYIGYEKPSNYLMHHGVKGMKWGVRNEERRQRAQKRQSSANSTLIGNIVGLPRLGTTGAVRRETIKNMTKEEHKKYNTARKVGNVGMALGTIGNGAQYIGQMSKNNTLATVGSALGIAGGATAMGGGIAEFATRRKAAKRLGYTGNSESAKNKRREIREQNSLLRREGLRKAFK